MCPKIGGQQSKKKYGVQKVSKNLGSKKCPKIWGPKSLGSKKCPKIWGPLQKVHKNLRSKKCTKIWGPKSAQKSDLKVPKNL